MNKKEVAGKLLKAVEHKRGQVDEMRKRLMHEEDDLAFQEDLLTIAQEAAEEN